MRGAKYAAHIRELLSPLAKSVDLDFDIETIRPGNTPVQLAYAFVVCGGHLLVQLADPDRVPSNDKRTSKHVARAMARSFDRQEAREAAVFLAQAFALDLYEFFRFREEQTSADGHLEFRDLIQQHFPLSDELVARLHETRAEYRTLETHEVREEVRTFIEMGTGYSRALLEGDSNPDDDEELVQIQRRYAGTFLRGHALLTAIELTIGRSALDEVKDKLMYPGGLDGYEGMTFWLATDAAWTTVGEQWNRVMKRALGATLPENDQLDIGPADPVVAHLRQGIVNRLESEDHGPLPDRTQQALSHFANDIAASAVDWGILTDALLMGYSLRVAERELPSATAFDEQTVANLRELEAEEPEIALVGFALQVADDLPAVFGQGGSSWAQLAAWAGQRALDRDQARRNAGMETGDMPAVTAQDCERAFGLGYSVCYVEEGLDATAPRTSGLATEYAADFDPATPGVVDVRDVAIDLLTRTEQIFVEVGAPAPLALLITRASLMGRYHADEQHPQYGALLGVTVFGYAVRMAQATRAPLPEHAVAQIDRWITRDEEGNADHEAMGEKPEALQEVAGYTGALADDRMRLLALLRIPLPVWTEFQRLATYQLHRNMRKNGVKRRLLPSADVIENLICLGCAVRIIDEVAGDSPPLKSDFGLT